MSGGVEAVKAFEDIGADELVLGSGVADLDEVSRPADAVLQRRTRSGRTSGSQVICPRCDEGHPTSIRSGPSHILG